MRAPAMHMSVLGLNHWVHRCAELKPKACQCWGRRSEVVLGGCRDCKARHRIDFCHSRCRHGYIVESAAAELAMIGDGLYQGFVLPLKQFN